MVFLCVYPIFLFIVILIAVVISQLLLRRPNRNMTLYWVVTALVIVIPLALAAGGMALVAASDYTGICYGFTDGQSECSFSEYMTNEMAYVEMFLWPALILHPLVVSGIFLVGWLARRSRPKMMPLPGVSEGLSGGVCDPGDGSEIK